MKFRKYFIAKNDIKARVLYSLDNRIDGRKCVTIYANDWTRNLGKLFSEYKNDTDSMTDYFDQGYVVLFEDHELYLEARNYVESLRIQK